MSVPVMELAVRAQAVGIDPWRVLRPGTHEERLITRALVDRVETAHATRDLANADLIGRRVINGLLDILAMFDLVERKP